jgi:hypothetical protein
MSFSNIGALRAPRLRPAPTIRGSLSGARTRRSTAQRAQCPLTAQFDNRLGGAILSEVWRSVLQGLERASDSRGAALGALIGTPGIFEGADMKQFELEDKMLTLRGVFYPTGYMFIMFPTEKDARDAEYALEEAQGHSSDSVSLLTPQDILQKIARTVGNADLPLPSAGTEADTVRHFTELASQGHYALMIRAPTAAETERVMEVLKKFPISYAQKYRHLVIEDLVE